MHREIQVDWSQFHCVADAACSSFIMSESPCNAAQAGKALSGFPCWLQSGRQRSEGALRRARALPVPHLRVAAEALETRLEELNC